MATIFVTNILFTLITFKTLLKNKNFMKNKYSCFFGLSVKLKLHYTYLGNKYLYCIFKTSCMTSITFLIKCCSFHTCIFHSSNNIYIFHKQALICKYHAHETPQCQQNSLNLNSVSQSLIL